MKIITLSFIVILLLISSQIKSQNIKGFYVNGFNNILGNTLLEDSLLLFAKNNGFNYLTLYDMHLVNNNTPLTNVTTAQTFANFVNKAKTQFNIAEIGVAAENLWFFNSIIKVYNQQHPSMNEKVDVYNFEFEFWVPSAVTNGGYYCTTYLQPGGYTCDTAGAFAYYKKTLKSIDSLANLSGQKSEAYFGWFNSGQGKQIVQTGVDRILLSVYLPSVNYSQNYQYNYIQPRLQYLASANTNVKVIPIYSAETSFMNSWAILNPFFLPYTDFTNSLTNETGSWRTFIQPEGIQWFAYSYLPKKNMTEINNNFQNTNNNLFCYFDVTNNNINIEINQQLTESSILITNILGEVIYSQITEYPNTIINTEKYSKGVYFVTIENKYDKSTKKIIVK